jgi:hypothetical protein
VATYPRVTAARDQMIGNDRQDLYRDRRDTNLDEVQEASNPVLASLIEALPDARSKFDELRGERTEG